MGSYSNNQESSNIYTITLNPPIYIDVFVKNLPKRYRVSMSNELITENSKVRITEDVFAGVNDSVANLKQYGISSRAVKKISVNNEVVLSADPISSKIPIYPDSNEMILSSSLTILGSSDGRLSDMDDYSLAEFDDVALLNIDTVVK